jgi:hypothetical protein
MMAMRLNEKHIIQEVVENIPHTDGKMLINASF